MTDSTPFPNPVFLSDAASPQPEVSPAEAVSLAVLRAQRGDSTAFESVYREHVDRVYTLVRRITGDAATADEVCQDVFVRVWEKIGSFRGESAFSTWLHRLAVNVALVDRRSTGRRLARVTPDGDPADAAPD
ncbi:MAG: RNA polymerase sigma factor, partial [Myxococcota bacterium]